MECLSVSGSFVRLLLVAFCFWMLCLGVILCSVLGEWDGTGIDFAWRLVCFSICAVHVVRLRGFSIPEQ